MIYKKLQFKGNGMRIILSYSTRNKKTTLPNVLFILLIHKMFLPYMGSMTPLSRQ